MTDTIFAIIATTAFWIAFITIGSISSHENDINIYRQGFAECKAGMESRMDRKDKP